MTRREAVATLLLLPSDTTARLLDRHFPEPGLSYALIDISTGRSIATRWPEIDRAIPLGSLTKPFVAAAYNRPFPVITCHGCWKPQGHGRLTITQALAFSCNTYFLALAREITAAPFGLPAPQPATPDSWIGLGDAWRIPPLKLLEAYRQLLDSAPQPILEGLRLSARIGTSQAIAGDAFAKTGTAPCRHTPKSSGDGYSIALYPAPRPRIALLTGLDNAPGARAAAVAGCILKLAS